MGEFHSLIAGTVFKWIRFDQEDVIQIIYSKLINNNYQLFKKFRGTTHYELIAYIQRISANTSLNYVKKHSKNRSSSTEIDDYIQNLLTDDNNPEKLLLEQEQEQVFHEKIEELDMHYKEVILLLADGYVHREIAQMLGLSINTVSTRVRRAKKLLKKKLDLVNEN